jgi:hypothetical protein
MEKTTLKEMDIERLKAWLQKLAPDHYDKIDSNALIDRTLTYGENKNILSQHYKGMLKTLGEQVEYVKAQQEKLDQERIRAAEQEVSEYNSQVSYSGNKEVEAYYSPIYRGVAKLCQGYSNLFFVKGRGGIGKTANLRKALARNSADFIELTGEVTEAYLYRLIFENNGKIIYLKDLVKLLQGQGSLNLLKAACESEEKRVLTKSSYSREQSDLPDQFLCRSKFIFDYNNLHGSGLEADFEALTSRGDYVELAFCDEEIQTIMRLIAEEPWQKEVTEYLISGYKESGLFRLNLRTQYKAFKTYNYSQANNLDWKKELSDELSRNNKTRALLYSLIGNKAVRCAELKKKLLRLELVHTIRTADNKINEWLYTEELWKVSEEDTNFCVCINPIRR